MKQHNALDRQRHIYTTGFAGIRPVVPINSSVLEAEAARVMSPEAHGYIAGGAGQEKTMQANLSAFDRYQIVPRMLQDVSVRDTSLTLFGRVIPAPLLLAPIGVLEMVHPEADKAVGKAAASLGIPYIFSNQASVPMEEVSKAMAAGARWFQLYWSRSDELVESLVKRAEACGCEAIVITLDTTMLGWRTRDLDMAYLPFLEGKGIAQYTSDPVFMRLLEQAVPQAAGQSPKVSARAIENLLGLLKRHPGSFFQNLKSGRALAAVRQFTGIYTNPALTWEKIDMLRKFTSLPVLLKGILHPDDARKALDAGMDGIVVSNHGGRQVDGAIAALDALPPVAEVVQGRIPVLMDSGIRSGADVFKALALGATAVCLGRPYVYGLALAGEEGVKEVLANLLADFELTMALSGCRSLIEITRDYLA